MSIEAMKHYEAALLKAFPRGATGDVFEHWNKARQAIAQAEKQEPVAWMYDFLNTDNRDEVIRNWTTQDYADIEREKGFNVRPLYIHQPEKQDKFCDDNCVWTDHHPDCVRAEKQEPCYCDANGIGEPGVSCGDCPTRDYKKINHPPKREWVGLTLDEIDLLEELYAPPVHPDFVNDANHCLELIRHVEAKLKEKNT